MSQEKQCASVYNRCCETNSVKYYYWTFYRTSPNSVVSNLEANKYKLLMKIPLDDVEIVKGIYIGPRYMKWILIIIII